MTLEQIIAAAKRSPVVRELLRDALAERVPAPPDLNARILASRRVESTDQRADRLSGFFRGAARPIGAAPAAQPRVTTAGEVPAPPSLVDRILQQRKGA